MSERPTNFTEAVLVPGAQALICGVLFALAGVAIYHAWGVRTGWALFWAGLSGVAFIAWLMVLKRWLSWSDALAGIMPAPVEPVTYASETLNLRVDWDDGHQGLFAQFGVSREMFLTWCAGVATGTPLSENHWTGRGAPFSKGEYHRMRAELERRGFLRLRGKYHAQGYELSSMGQAVVGEISRRYSLGDPTPIGRLAMIAGKSTR